MNFSTDQTTQNLWLRVIRWLIALLVAAGVGYAIWDSSSQLKEQNFKFREIKYGWWVAAIGCYLGATLLSGTFWHRVLIAMNQRPELGKSLAAFYISQLGKYVPGKAMVVVLRSDRIRGDHVAVGPAVASVFIETFIWLFTGSAIASVLLFLLFENRYIQAMAAVVMVIAGALSSPPTIHWIANWMGQVKGKKTANAMRGLTAKTIVRGWIHLTIGWCLGGLSLWLVLRGLPDVSPKPMDYWLTLACVTLSTAIGFVTLLPGGLGVRELVMIPLLSTRFDSAVVVVGVIAIRAVWLVSELLMATLAYCGLFERQEG